MRIGVFDSGYGGLTILDKIRQELPQYDYLYLGDNARAPYGTRSFEQIYEYTWQAVEWLFQHDCRLIIIACNTASAKALRTIQTHHIDPQKQRVLGVIRPTVEVVPLITHNGHIGILATPGTVNSNSYVLELEKMMDNVSMPLQISQKACPMWVPLIEAGKSQSEEMKKYIQLYLDELLHQDANIDTILLGCTHYPIIKNLIDDYLENHNIQTVAQGEIIAHSLHQYLLRHIDICQALSTHGECVYCTTGDSIQFEHSANMFLKANISAIHVDL